MHTLDDVHRTAFGRLAEGAGDPGSGWRHVALGTIGEGGQPRVRTLVLRAFDPQARTLDLHSDRRSAKAAELRRQPRAAVHVWHAPTSEQIRLQGHVSVHAADAVARQAWSALRPASRDTYRVTPGPGTVIGDPGEAMPGAGDDSAFAAFMVLRLHIGEMEYLLIDQSGHRRARFTWAEGRLASMWLVP
jgi:hypothetical protein